VPPHQAVVSGPATPALPKPASNHGRSTHDTARPRHTVLLYIFPFTRADMAVKFVSSSPLSIPLAIPPLAPRYRSDSLSTTNHRPFQRMGREVHLRRGCHNFRDTGVSRTVATPLTSFIVTQLSALREAAFLFSIFCVNSRNPGDSCLLHRWRNIPGDSDFSLIANKPHTISTRRMF
jgi:hypothetical protein